MHTHQTWAVALNMLQNNRLLAASQSAAYFQGRIAYDDNYAGSADTLEEGERERLFFEAMKRVGNRELPGYAD